MPPRLAHKKSRNGCVECRARRVKCDEQDPRCSNCVRHGKSCTKRMKFVVATDLAARGESKAATDDDTPEYSSLDLELLHWFIVKTSTSLNFGPEAELAWAHSVVDQALKRQFLMRALLAVSALHKSIECPQEKTSLLKKASVLISSSLSLVKPSLESPSDADCYALFPFSALISIYAVGAAGHHHEATDSAIDKFMEAWSLVRGSALIANTNSKSLRASKSLQPFFQLDGGQKPFSLPEEMPKVLDLMALFCQQMDERLIILQHALEGIDHDIERIAATGSNLFTLRWLASISDDFIDMVKQRDIRALAVVAVYAPLMQDIVQKTWIFGSWSHWLGKETISYLNGTRLYDPVARLVRRIELVLGDVASRG